MHYKNSHKLTNVLAISNKLKIYCSAIIHLLLININKIYRLGNNKFTKLKYTINIINIVIY